ncbi:MAG: translocation/assembly module TamB domain-containing protein [Candidatus Krumholzibacteria bacterium]|nr:translocation/assembly module TamB domain-containing protein [Candidatus Krumholzibacteria bacterium]
MRRTLRIISRVLAGIALTAGVLVALAAAAVAFLVGTTSGGRIALRTLDRLPVGVAVGEFHGRLASRFELRGMSLDAPPISVTAERVAVAWRPLALHGRRLDLRDIEVEGLAVAIAARDDTVPAAPDTASARPAGRPALPVEIMVGRLLLRDADVMAPGVVATISELTAAGGMDDARVTARAHVMPEGMPAADVALGARASWHEARIDSLRVGLAGGVVALSGTTSWLPEVRWDVLLRVDGIAPGVILGDTAGWPGVLSLRGSSNGTVTADGPWAFAKIDTLAGLLRGYPLDGRITVEIAPAGADIAELVLAVAGGTVRVAGDVAWSPRVQWALAVEADGVDPAGITPAAADWPGRVDLRVRSEGKLTDGGIVATARIDTLEGTVRERSLRARAEGRVRGREVEITDLALALGGNELRVSGVIGDTLAIGVDAILPDLALAHADVGGAARVEAHASGPRGAPRVRARVSADTLRFRHYRVAALSVDADADLAPGGGVDIQLEADSLRAAGRAIDRLYARVAGRVEKHTFSAHASAGSTSVRIAAAGAYAERAWAGALDSLTVGGTPAGDWRTRAPAEVAVASERVSVSRLVLDSNGASIALDGRWARGDSAALHFEIQRVPAALAQLVLPAGWSASGTVDAAAAAALAPDGGLRADLSVPPATFEIRLPVGEGHEVLRLDSTAVAVRVDSSGSAASLHVNLVYRGESVARLRGEGTAPGLSRADRFTSEQPVSFRVAAGASDLSFLGRLSPPIAPTAGSFDFVAEGEGTLGSLPVRWEMEVAGGAARLRTYGLQLQDVAMNAHGVRGKGFTLEGMARSGGGELRLETTLDRRGDERRSRIRVHGRRFEIANTAQARVTVSPDVTVDIAGRKVALEGDVEIPWAKIELLDVPQSAVGVSKDVVIAGEEHPGEAPVDVTARLRFALGDSVEFRGFNLTAKLEGGVLVIEEPGRPTAGSGELRIEDGKYNAYGQPLEIDPGKIVFTGGPIDNPGLDIRAYRKASDGVIAGVRVRGTARDPRIEVFSEPAMSQSEALSYLITGRPLDQAQGSQSDMVAAAALSLGMQQGNVLTQSMGREMGLDEARLEMTSSGAAAFTSGKYLSPRLYISNTLGLFDQSVIWRVQYMLSAQWTLQAESGVSTGSDLFYKIEW